MVRGCSSRGHRLYLSVHAHARRGRGGDAVHGADRGEGLP